MMSMSALYRPFGPPSPTGLAIDHKSLSAAQDKVLVSWSWPFSFLVLGIMLAVRGIG
jgi:hypothetical protein